MLELPDQAHAAHRYVRPIAQHGDLSPGLFSFCFDQTTDHIKVAAQGFSKTLAAHTDNQSRHRVWRVQS